MPHQCTNCGRAFPDGSKEMLSGCPDCGGNKFQFEPASSSADPSAADVDPNSADADPNAVDAEPAAGTGVDAGVAGPDTETPETPGSAGSRDRTGRANTADDGDAADTPTAGEDGAQASARSDVVSEDELAAAAEPANRTEETTADVADATDDAAEPGTDPDLDALRRKLNDQFESIRIVSPGKYELNLMELYDREEYIISLREDGRYVIEMPEGWDDR